MNSAQGTVFVVDDDPSVRKALRRLCESAGLTVKTYASAREFLDDGAPACPACLVLDVRMPGLSGLDLQAELAARNVTHRLSSSPATATFRPACAAMRAGAWITSPNPSSSRMCST
jgi:FixJ family two-component response regulator